MSTVSEVLAVVEKWPEPQRNELLLRLLNLPSPKSSKPYITKAVPLGVRNDKLPADLLADEEDLAFLNATKRG